MKKGLLFLGISLLVVILLFQGDLQKIYDNIKNIDTKLLLTACLMQCVTILLINGQWYSIAKELKLDLSLKHILHANMIGTFTESITPSVKAGGEVTKVYALNKQGKIPMGSAWALVGIQKVISFTAFLAMNILSIFFLIFTVVLEKTQIKIILLCFGFLFFLMLIMILLIYNPKKLEIFLNILPFSHSVKQNIKKQIDVFKGVLEKTKDNKLFWFWQLLLAIIIWNLFPLKAYYIAKGLGIHIAFVPMAVVTYLAYMMGMFPLLPGGAGTFEGGMTLFLLPMEIPTYEGVLLAMVLRLVTFWFVFSLSALYLIGHYGIKGLVFINSRHSS